MCLWIGIQDVSSKIQGPVQEPGPWVWTVNHTTDRVCGLVASATLPAKGIWVSTLLLGIDLLTLV